MDDGCVVLSHRLNKYEINNKQRLGTGYKNIEVRYYEDNFIQKYNCLARDSKESHH